MENEAKYKWRSRRLRGEKVNVGKSVRGSECHKGSAASNRVKGRSDEGDGRGVSDSGHWNPPLAKFLVSDVGGGDGVGCGSVADHCLLEQGSPLSEVSLLADAVGDVSGDVDQAAVGCQVTVIGSDVLLGAADVDSGDSLPGQSSEAAVDGVVRVPGPCVEHRKADLDSGELLEALPVRSEDERPPHVRRPELALSAGRVLRRAPEPNLVADAGGQQGQRSTA